MRGNALVRSETGLGLTSVFWMFVDGATIYACSDRTVSSSVDDGVNWTALPTGFTDRARRVEERSRHARGGQFRDQAVDRLGRLVERADVGATGAGDCLQRVHPGRPRALHSATEITFSIPRAARVRVEVFDLTGTRVARLVEGDRAAGRHTVSWDLRTLRGDRARPGVYIYYELAAAEGRLAKKMVVTH